MPERKDLPHDAQREQWSLLRPGDVVTVVKLSPDGAEAARYAGEVAAVDDPPPWVIVRATWTYSALDLDGLALRPGDQLLEWFSPRHPFNAFAVLTPKGRLRGWYANVTHPARLEESSQPPDLVWHDLYVDLVGMPDGAFTVRDEDELEASALQERDPELYRRIIDAQAELIERFTQRQVPFIGVASTHFKATITAPSAAN